MYCDIFKNKSGCNKYRGLLFLFSVKEAGIINEYNTCWAEEKLNGFTSIGWWPAVSTENRFKNYLIGCLKHECASWLETNHWDVPKPRLGGQECNYLDLRKRSNRCTFSLLPFA